jgi:alginate O-acetyltransferase complex protein AlgI
MLFNSYQFIFLFLPITLAIFFSLSKFKLTKLALVWLTISSLFFYSYWNIFTAPKNPDKSRHIERAVLSTISAEESRLRKEVR